MHGQVEAAPFLKNIFPMSESRFFERYRADKEQLAQWLQQLAMGRRNYQS